VSERPVETPRDGAAACALLQAQPDARVVAGGTDILVRLKDQCAWPPLVDVSRLEELRGIACEGAWLRVGALTTWTEVERDALLQRHADVLVEAAHEVGSPQIRNRGTLGGNVANASPAGDAIPALLALDAEIELRGMAGTRRVAAGAFFCGPGKTVLTHDELIVAFWLPVRAGWRGTFLRLGQRAALAISKVSVAVRLCGAGRQVEDCRIALGAVAPTVIRAPAAENALCGRPLDAAGMAAAAAAVCAAARPITDIRSNEPYRRAMCGELLCRALTRLAQTSDTSDASNSSDDKK
jgi:CO/xanthine dehydrogenase FAD-binding subunit